MEHEKVVIATDNDFGTGREGELQVLVVLGITAFGHAHGRLEPDGRTPQNFQEASTPRERDRTREFRAVQNPGCSS